MKNDFVFNVKMYEDAENALMNYVPIVARNMSVIDVTQWIVVRCHIIVKAVMRENVVSNLSTVNIVMKCIV